MTASQLPDQRVSEHNVRSASANERNRTDLDAGRDHAPKPLPRAAGTKRRGIDDVSAATTGDGRRTKDPVKRKMVSVLPYDADFAIRVSVVEVQGVRGVDVSDFVPSIKKDGRGIVIPLIDGPELLEQVIEALTKIAKAEKP